MTQYQNNLTIKLCAFRRFFVIVKRTHERKEKKKIREIAWIEFWSYSYWWIYRKSISIDSLVLGHDADRVLWVLKTKSIMREKHKKKEINEANVLVSLFVRYCCHYLLSSSFRIQCAINVADKSGHCYLLPKVFSTSSCGTIISLSLFRPLFFPLCVKLYAIISGSCN